MPTLPAISVLIATYDAATTIGPLVDELAGTLEGTAEDWEAILVDDGSTDGSWPEIEALARRHPQVRGIRLARNHGQHNALLCGIRAARHPVLVTMDDDFQHPPTEVPALVAGLEGADLVYGVPHRDRHRRWRRGAAVVVKPALERALGMPRGRDVTSFRAFRASLADELETDPGPLFSLDVLLSRTTTRVAGLPVRHDQRRAGRSNYTLGRLVTHTMNMATAYSVAPMRVASGVGLVMTVSGGVALIAFGILVVAGGGAWGTALLGALVTSLAGVQLLVLGLLGEYVARIHLRLHGGPSYLVAGTTEQARSGAERS